MKLYHYVHCPFCVRVRLALGYLNIAYESVVLKYDDELTPVALTGKKMLPAFEFDKNKIINESLDIIKNLDSNNKLCIELYVNNKSLIDAELSIIGSSVHSLCMPYWVWTQEFDEKSRIYFTYKKEQTRGPFTELIKNKNHYINELNKYLHNFELNLTPFYKSEQLTINDILFASHLWGMYIFPEFQFSPKINNYLQNIKNLCGFNYHQDYWK